MLAAAAWGPTLAGAVAAGAARYPRATAVVDERGAMTAGELWAASDAVAVGLRRRGVGPGSTVGILARNHRGFVLGLVATAKLGADLVFLNTGFAGPQLADVVDSETIDVVLHDDEFAAIVEGCGAEAVVGESELDELAGRRLAVPLRPITRQPGRTVILTSGTTGRPKGAARSSAGGADSLGSILSTIPVRARDTVVVAAPLFHAWGLAHLGMALSLSSTVVLDRRFDAERTVAAVADHHADGLVVVPVMLRRMLDLGPAVLDEYDTSALRYIASSGSALGATLATGALERFGPVLYNVYGSTEVSLATVAGPADLAAAPATAGRPPAGSTVRIFDGAGRPVPTGETGRVFVGNSSRFDGYTGGGGKESIDGLLSIGDLGTLRRRRPAVHRRPGRRDDRVGRRERVPGRGRGPADRPPRGAGGSGRRRGRRGAGTAVGGLRREAAARQGHGRATAEPTSATTWPATRCPRRCTSSRSCRARRPARCASGT